MGEIFRRRKNVVNDNGPRPSIVERMDLSLERLFVDLLRPQRGERVLEIGCGTGDNLLLLKRLGLDVSCLDSSAPLINAARERLGPCCTFKLGAPEDLPYDDNEFDLVVLINLLDFHAAPVAVLREAGRVARRGVFVCVLNSLSWHGVAKRIQACLDWPPAAAPRQYNIWQLKSLVRIAYGPVPTSWGCAKVPYPLRKEGGGRFKGLPMWKNSPFGCLLAISATMVYRLKADTLPLGARLRRAHRTLIEPSTMEGLTLRRGITYHERGIPVQEPGGPEGPLRPV